MQGRASGASGAARYICSSRRATRSCDQPLASAEEVEGQLVEFIEGFAPGEEVQQEILRRLAEDAGPESHEGLKRREALEERLRRMRDLYELGDLDRAEYVSRRNAINAELDAMAPGPLLDHDHAREVLKDFSIFWREESDHDAKRQFLSLIFEGVWLDDRRVVAVQPKPSCLAYFESAKAGQPPAEPGIEGRRAHAGLGG